MNRTALFYLMIFAAGRLCAQIATGGAYSLESSLFTGSMQAQNGQHSIAASIGDKFSMVKSPQQRIYAGFLAPLKIDPAISYSASLESGSVVFLIPAGSVSGPYELMLEQEPLDHPIALPPAALQQGIQQIASLFGSFVQTPREALEIRALMEDNTLFAEDLAGSAEFTMNYVDRGDGGEVLIRRFDEDNLLWSELSSDLGSTQGIAHFLHRRFGLFAVFQQGPTQVAHAYAFPVPWRPNANNATLYGNRQDGITFTNLPTVGLIRIYNLAGEMVREIRIPPGNAELSWDVTTDSGKPVASGVYIWAVKSDRHAKLGKLMVIR